MKPYYLTTVYCAILCLTNLATGYEKPALGVGLGEEIITKDEATTIAELVRLNLSGFEAEQGKAKRDQHSKHHGLVRASFVVRDDIPEHLRHGIYAKPVTFKALIRFSNGLQTDDRKAEAHGMAIKLLGIDGPKLREGHEQQATHDFVLVDHEVFFIADMADYLTLNQDVAAMKKSIFGKIYFGAKLLLWERNLMSRMQAFAGQTPSSPLASHYWSTTPYRLGKHAVKYVAKLPLANSDNSQTGVSTENGLSEALVRHLNSKTATFEFGVDVQEDPVKYPVEDATVNWRENGAPFVTLATIEVPVQKVDPGEEAAEDLVFSPWQVSETHRPLGAINRARKAVYDAMADKRHKLNGITQTSYDQIP